MSTELSTQAVEQYRLTLRGISAAIAKCQDIPQLLELTDRAAVIMAYAKKRGYDLGLVNDAARVYLDGRRGLGVELAKRDKQQGARGNPGGQGAKFVGSHDATPQTLADLGLTKSESSRTQIEAGIPDLDYASWFDEIRPIREVTAAELRKLARKPKEYAPEKPDFGPPQVWWAPYDEWLPTQPDCDLLFTDPPYMTDVENIDEFAMEWLPEGLAKVKATGRAYVCIGAYPDELAAYLNIVPPEWLTLDNILVWTYRNTLGQMPKHSYKLNWQAILYYRGVDAPPLTIPKTKDQFAVFDVNAPDGRLGDRCHTWQKPSGLAEIFIQQSTAEGDLVLDPFCCTGTFLLAANKFGRIGRGCDVDNDNLKLAEKRGCEIQ